MDVTNSWAGVHCETLPALPRRHLWVDTENARHIARFKRQQIADLGIFPPKRYDAYTSAPLAASDSRPNSIGYQSECYRRKAGGLRRSWRTDLCAAVGPCQSRACIGSMAKDTEVTAKTRGTVLEKIFDRQALKQKSSRCINKGG